MLLWETLTGSQASLLFPAAIQTAPLQQRQKDRSKQFTVPLAYHCKVHIWKWQIDFSYQQGNVDSHPFQQGIKCISTEFLLLLTPLFAKSYLEKLEENQLIEAAFKIRKLLSINLKIRTSVMINYVSAVNKMHILWKKNTSNPPSQNSKLTPDAISARTW